MTGVVNSIVRRGLVTPLFEGEDEVGERTIARYEDEECARRRVVIRLTSGQGQWGTILPGSQWLMCVGEHEKGAAGDYCETKTRWPMGCRGLPRQTDLG